MKNGRASGKLGYCIFTLVKKRACNTLPLLISHKYVFICTGCGYYEIVSTLEHSSVFSIFIQEWSSFARALETPPAKVVTLRQGITLGLKSHTDVLVDLLMEWRSRKSNEATLGVLLEAMRRFNWNAMAG